MPLTSVLNLNPTLALAAKSPIYIRLPCPSHPRLRTLTCSTIAPTTHAAGRTLRDSPPSRAHRLRAPSIAAASPGFRRPRWRAPVAADRLRSTLVSFLRLLE